MQRRGTMNSRFKKYRAQICRVRFISVYCMLSSIACTGWENSERLKERTLSPEHADIWTPLADGVLWTQTLPQARGDSVCVPSFLRRTVKRKNLRWSLWADSFIPGQPHFCVQLKSCTVPGEYKEKGGERSQIQLAETWSYATTKIKKIKLRKGKGEIKKGKNKGVKIEFEQRQLNVASHGRNFGTNSFFYTRQYIIIASQEPCLDTSFWLTAEGRLSSSETGLHYSHGEQKDMHCSRNDTFESGKGLFVVEEERGAVGPALTVVHPPQSSAPRGVLPNRCSHDY